jgi:hypothetical protein
MLCRQSLAFNADGRPMWLRDEKLVILNRDTLQQLVAEYVVTPKAVFTDSGELSVRFEPYAIGEAEISFLLSGKSLQEGGLRFRLPSLQMPSPPAGAQRAAAAG